MKTKLTPEQSNRLIELGVDPSKASTTRLDFNGTYVYVSGEEAEVVKSCVNGQFYVEENKVFDLTDILVLLPKNIESAWLDMYHINTNEWAVCYEQWDNLGDLGIWQDSYHTAPELIDALYKLLCWILTKDKK